MYSLYKSSEQLADIFTKGISSKVFDFIVNSDQTFKVFLVFLLVF